MQATRQQILDYLRRHGQATVKDIGQHLGLTATGIRQHLTVLERDGLVDAHEERGHVGRPALVYRLSPVGDALYPKKYDELANALIEEARSVLGSQALARLMKSVAARFAAAQQSRVAGKPLVERVQAASEVLENRGSVVTLTAQDGDYAIRTHTCPYWNVATKNSIICALDVEFVRQLVGEDMRLTTSLLRGDDCCTFHIRGAAQPHKGTAQPVEGAPQAASSASEPGAGAR
jgi:predicted ArsR family transcriptional regulator